MNRRRFLSLCGGVIASAGCTAGPADEARAPTAATSAGAPSATRTPLPLARRGDPAGICGHEPARVGIRAISVPATAPDWADVETDGYGTLTDDTVVVGLDVGIQPRAYPLRVLWTHEIVNDTIPLTDGGRPVLVTYCSICRSGMVAERIVAGTPTVFGVSGLLWRPPARSETGPAVFGADLQGSTDPERENNLVLYDVETGSYWSQWLARAICGPRTGSILRILPSTVTTWAEWTDRHPGTDVLLPPPRSGAFNPPFPGGSPGR